MADTHPHNNISSAAFADNLLCPTVNLKNLKIPVKIQAFKLTLYSDWASLIVSGGKTRVTDKLNAHANKSSLGQNTEDTLIHELNDTILVQGLLVLALVLALLSDKKLSSSPPAPLSCILVWSLPWTFAENTSTDAWLIT